MDDISRMLQFFKKRASTTENMGFLPHALPVLETILANDKTVSTEKEDDFINPFFDSVKNITATENLLRYIINDKPNSGYLHSMLGEILRLEGRLEESVNECATAMNLSPNHGGTLGHGAEILLELGLAHESIKAINKAIILTDKNNPKIANLYGILAKAYNHLEKSELAEETANLGLSVYPNNTVCLMELSRSTMALQKYDLAISTIEKLNQLTPESPYHYSGISEIYKLKKDFAKALKFIDIAINKFPQVDELYYEKAQTQLYAEKYDEAKSTINKIKNDALREESLARYYLSQNLTMLALDSAMKVSEIYSQPQSRKELFKEALYHKDNRTENSNIMVPQTGYAFNPKWMMDNANALIGEIIKKHTIQNGFHDLIDSLKDNKNLSNNFSYVLCALLDVSGDECKNREMTRELFKNILANNPNLITSVNAQSRNMVEIISANAISENLYFIKTLPRDNPEGREKLDREYKITRIVNSIISRSPKAILLEQPYLIEKRIHLPTLASFEEDADQPELVNEIKMCIDTLSEVYDNIRINRLSDREFEIRHHDNIDNAEYVLKIPQYDFISELSRRLVARCQADGREFVAEYSKVISNISFENKFIHADAHTKNWMKGGILIDWEKPYVGDPLIDITALIYDPEFSDLNKQQFIDYYYDISGNSKSNNLEEKYYFVRMHNALCQFGSKYYINDQQNALDYMDQIIEYSSKYPALQNKFVEFMKASKIIA